MSVNEVVPLEYSISISTIMPVLSLIVGKASGFDVMASLSSPTHMYDYSKIISCILLFNELRYSCCMVSKAFKLNDVLRKNILFDHVKQHN